ncbi:hypothetical protein CYMTET_34828 [Cymbomonas tetramitiformis]|uniref:Uncharacterized protein n=1 Tax=Cymbomonas tetramitiformis TaxID=36881 RepID=A0AAE0FAD8_9CHLO|nr:hypothetical protein CYMTET_34828 [Cymbomonas tetramitiformis]
MRFVGQAKSRDQRYMKDLISSGVSIASSRAWCVFTLWQVSHDDICKCSTLVWPLRAFCLDVTLPFPPQHPNAQPRTVFSLAFRIMAQSQSTRARKRLLKDSDLDSSIRLLDAVRDTPTASTPPVVPPAASSNSDDAAALQ